MKNSSETDESEEIGDTMKKAPPPPLKPKPARSIKNAPSPTKSTNSTVNTKAFQTETEQTTERAETFQIVAEESDKIVKPSTTQNSSTENLSSKFEKLVTEKQSKSVIQSAENVADKQKPNEQEVDKTKTEVQSESPVMMRKKNSPSSPYDMDQFKGR